MSYKNLMRIKLIRGSTGGGVFSTPYPIGTDGLLVDMISGLDLEELNRLGGNHYVQVEESNRRTVITLYYFSTSKGNNSLLYMQENNYVTYRIVTIINSPYNLDELLMDTNGDFIIAGNNIYLAVGSASSEDMTISSYLYKGNSTTPLHNKVITFNLSSSTTIIEENVANLGGNN